MSPAAFPIHDDLTATIPHADLRPHAAHAEAPDSAAPHATTRATRLAALSEEARRLERRRSIAEAIADRCEPGARGLGLADAGALRLRALRRAVGLRVRFHGVVDSLILAGGFDEAMQLLRERSGDLRNHAPPRRPAA